MSIVRLLLGMVESVRSGHLLGVGLLKCWLPKLIDPMVMLSLLQKTDSTIFIMAILRRDTLTKALRN